MKNRIIISLFLLAVFCVVPVFAQENSNLKNECELYTKNEFVGSLISFDFAETDIRYVLQYFSEQFGCKFKLDESVGFVPITVKAENVSWTYALRYTLQFNDLDLISKNETDEIKNTENTFLFIADKDKILREKEKNIPIYTEIIRLKNLPVCGNIAECEQCLEKVNYIKKITSRRLSRHGSIEYDDKNQTFIFTDVRSNLDNIVKILEILDTSDFYTKSAEEFIMTLNKKQD